MNWKVLVAGAFTILVIFLAFLGFQFIENKKRVSIQNQPQQSYNLTFFENGIPSEEAKRIAKAEVMSQTLLVRGEVTQFNKNTNTATVAIETKQLNGTIAVIGLLDISIDPKQIKEFSCWPNAFKSATGQEISIRNAYMPVNSNSILYIKGEVKKPINQIQQYLNLKPFVFILLNSSPTDAQAVLTDTSGLPTQLAKEVAILGCTE